MRGSAAFRTGVAPGGALAGPWVRNPLWTTARAVPSLDLRFAENKSLVDATTGSNLVTFTRASSGTFTGSDGVLRTAVTNLALQSEDFLTTWGTTQGTILTNQTTSPTGTNTADEFEDTGSASGVFQSITIRANTTHTASIYLKRNTTDWYRIYWGDSSFTNGLRVWVNLATGATGTTQTSGTSTIDATSISSIGNGWYRVSLTGVIDNSTTAGRLQINSAASDGSASRVLNAKAYLWGAQLEQSSTVGEYIPTTSTINSAPRFDHNPTTGESLGLLVEEARTNLLLRSEEFDNASWTKTRSSITANTIVAPNGTLTADKLVESTINGEHYTEQSIIPAAGTYTHTVFAKAGEYNQLRIRPVHIGEAFTTSAITFDLTTGPTATTNNLITNATMQILPNGWRRCSVTFTLTSAASSHSMRIQLLNADGSSVYTGDDVSGIYLWGAQLEAGAFPTSYIPTTTATVTRSADVASISGSNFSAWYRQDAFTAYVDARLLSNTSATSKHLFMVSDGTATNRIALYNSVFGAFRVFRGAGGANSDAEILNQASVLAGVRYRFSGAFASTNAAATVNGAAVTLLTDQPMPSGIDRFGLWRTYAGPDPANAHIARVTFWPTRLSNSTLQAITQ
jgi:hypothetical protein